MARIVVIDDEKELLDEILSILNFEGHEAIGAGNGRAGIRLAKDQQPDLIISDIMMTDLDGYDVLLALRIDNTTAMIPFIFLTAKSDRGDVRHGMELGADDYLTKPFTRDELLNAIQTRLSRQTMISRSKEEEIEQVKKTLVQNITSELRSPMESIDVVQELIEREMGRLTPQNLQVFLETLRSGSRRIRHVVAQIVYLTQIQTGVLCYDSLKEAGTVESLWTVVAESVKRPAGSPIVVVVLRWCCTNGTRERPWCGVIHTH
jgi:two-component system, sensor histidine kinase and response regulator